LATILACGAVDALIAGRVLDPERTLWFATALASVVLVVAAAGVASYERAGRSVQRAAVTPFTIAAGTWLVLFFLRPLELYIAPDHAATSLSEFGFRLDDLTRTTALAGLGAAAWCAGYLLALGPRLDGRRRTSSPRALTVSTRASAAALAFGTLLWFALFMRQGGPSALLHSAASIRVNENASFYGFIGVWIVQGMTLVALASQLLEPKRSTRRILVAGAALSLAAGLCLQVRGLTVFGAAAAAAIYLALRVPSRRALVVGACVVVLAVVALPAMQQVRAYSTLHTMSESLSLTARTPPWAMYVSDLSTFDNFVAMQSMIPASIPYLDGRSIAEIPEMLVPRSLWPGKPLGIDFRTSAYLYPSIYVAVPISLQGELYWNGGIAVVVIGALILGAAFGGVTRAGWRATSSAGLVLFAVTLPFTHGLLTRGLATQFENLLFALVGTLFAMAAATRTTPRVMLAWMREWARHRKPLLRHSHREPQRA
jgi:hypothetical protein